MYTKLLRVGLLLVILVAAGTVLAQNSGYDLSWWTVDSGGGSSTGGSFTLQGTIGQPDTGVLGGAYTLSGGYWTAKSLRGIYLPIVIRDS